MTEPTSFTETRELLIEALRPYNEERPHSSLDYLTPIQYEKKKQEEAKPWTTSGTEPGTGPLPPPPPAYLCKPEGYTSTSNFVTPLPALPNVTATAGMEAVWSDTTPCAS